MGEGCGLIYDVFDKAYLDYLDHTIPERSACIASTSIGVFLDFLSCSLSNLFCHITPIIRIVLTIPIIPLTVTCPLQNSSKTHTECPLRPSLTSPTTPSPTSNPPNTSTPLSNNSPKASATDPMPETYTPAVDNHPSTTTTRPSSETHFNPSAPTTMSNVMSTEYWRIIRLTRRHRSTHGHLRRCKRGRVNRGRED